jgi:SulP family sulfate permease
VIEGFTVGIAVIIFLQQVPNALGVPKPEGENAAAVAVRAVADAVGDPNVAVLGLLALTTAVMLVAPRVHRSLPGSLLAVAVTTGVAIVTGTSAAVIGTLPDSIPAPSLPGMSLGQMRDLLGAAFAIAALAMVESLLSAKVADGMADTGRHDPDRELFGQGFANVVSPLFGGMPATGAIARTAVNVRSGARTRVSALTHAVLLVLVVLFAGSLVSRIPLVALAGVLMVTAVRMVEVHNVRAVLSSTRSDAFVLVLTATATIAFDLIVAVEIGIALAALFALRAIAQNSSVVVEPVALGEIDGDAEADLLRNHIVAYRIDGAMFFGAAQRFLTELTAVSDVRVVILRLPDMQVLDATGAQALGEIVSELEARHITVLLKGPRPEHLRILGAVGVLDRLAHENHVFTSLDAAVAHARLHVARGSAADTTDTDTDAAA